MGAAQQHGDGAGRRAALQLELPLEGLVDLVRVRVRVRVRG